MPERSEPESVPSTAERLAAAGIEPIYRFWENFDERSVDLDRRLGRTAHAGATRVRAAGTATCRRSTFDDLWVDACRSLILIDTLGWPAVCRAAHRQRVHRAEHRHLVRVPPRPIQEPWLYAQATSVERERAASIGCEGKVWARDGALLAMGRASSLPPGA